MNINPSVRNRIRVFPVRPQSVLHQFEFMVLVILFMATGCKPEAETALEDKETSRLVKLSEMALSQERFDVALALCDSAIQRMPQAVEPYFLKGVIYTRLMQWDKVEEAYQQVIELDPDYEGVWNNRANNAMRQTKFSEALSYYLKEIQSRPAARPWHGAGRAYKELKQLDSAMVAYQRAISYDSTFIPAFVSYAELLETNGRYAEALALIERAHRIDPNHVGLDAVVGNLLLRLNSPEEAIPYFERVIARYPWHSEAHYRLVQALKRSGKEEESNALLKKTEKLSALQAEITRHQKMVGNQPDNPYAHATLATSFRMAGMYEEAMTSYNIALTLDPDNVEFLNNVASLHFLRKDTTAAILTYERILQKHPEVVEVWLNVGILRALSGDSALARRAWENALQIDPNNDQARAYLTRISVSDRP